MEGVTPMLELKSGWLRCYESFLDWKLLMFESEMFGGARCSRFEGFWFFWTLGTEKSEESN